MHPRLFHVALYLLRAQMTTNSQTRQTVLVLGYGDYRYIYSQNERTGSSFPVSNLVPFLIGKWIVRRYWVQRCTCPVGVCTRPNQVSHQADESEKKTMETYCS